MSTSPERSNDHAEPLLVPPWLASTLLELKRKRFTGYVQINFTHGSEATANIHWTVTPERPPR